MTFLSAVILGLVEGITEFLPISSTAHLMMTSELLDLTQTEFLKSFEIVIQFGAVAAVILMFGNRFLKNPLLWKKVTLAFIPTAVIGFALYKLIKTHLIGNLDVAIWSLIIGGVILLAVEFILFRKTKNGEELFNHHNGVSDITNKQAFWIGVIQSVAVIPGVSRAAATIVPALFFGASRKAAAEFSFLLAVPTVAAAALYDLIKNADVLVANNNLLLLSVGFIVSFIAAIGSIKVMMAFIQNHSFIPFGIYRIAVAILFLVFFI